MSDEREKLAQVIADSIFAMQAGQAWDAEGPESYERPVPNGGDMQIAVDLMAAGVRFVPRNAYADGYADGYASAQRGDPPYVEPSAVEDLSAEAVVVGILYRNLQWSYPEPLAGAQEADKGRDLSSWAREIVQAVRNTEEKP